MGLHRSLGTAHGGGGFGDAQPLQFPKQEALALSRGQRAQRAAQGLPGELVGDPARRIGLRIRPCLDRIVARGVTAAKKIKHAFSDGIAAVPVGQLPAQDAPEQRGPFAGRPFPVRK